MNQPFVFGWHDGELYLQAFDVLEDDKRDWSKSQPKLLSKTLSKRIQAELATRKETVDWQRVAQITKDPRGLVLSVSAVRPERSRGDCRGAARAEPHPQGRTGMARTTRRCRRRAT